MSDSMVDRRLRYIERQKALGHGVDVRFEGLKPAGSGPPNRHGLPSVPIDQHVVTNWPVLDLGDVPSVSIADWRLEITGLVENPMTLTWDDFLNLPQVEDVSDFHCVTSWSRLGNHWKGVQFRTLAELVVPKENTSHILCTGYDHDIGSREAYTTNVPLSRAIEDDVLLVHTWEDKPLPREHGGPCRMITPRLYAWKGTKWIRKIEFLDRDRSGFWERRGYSDTAEPWFNDRYST
ncbi:MAG TPA: molybdopterin-dependent oxidoreductase [Thermoanaerobaculia bacterium]|jgi:DMSO/TMAO reductase YedYZ molybdopterin-dependent catalytic subunit|nr:molybdopterin-dependent oxidoreductase [Thermoanaerobaculia bacterium]